MHSAFVLDTDQYPLNFALGDRFISYIDDNTIDLVWEILYTCVYLYATRLYHVWIFRSNAIHCERCKTLTVLLTVFDMLYC